MSLILKSINCDGNIETRKYKTIDGFVAHVDSKDENYALTAPMLDDCLESIVIDGKEERTRFETVNSLYEYAVKREDKGKENG